MLILNKHCLFCQFKEECERQAIEQNHISLLDGVSSLKQIRKYERKGIFSVNQLSYTYRPRRQRRRSRNTPSLQLSLALQALMIRTGKIYVHDQFFPLKRNQTEIFFDIEGNIDDERFYLFGVLIYQNGDMSYQPLWADSAQDEKLIWLNLIKIFEQYPDCPIYHYGNYEAKALSKLNKRYDTKANDIIQRLVNLNTYIYGKIYFPLRSNSLKTVAKFLGASWTSPNASSLQPVIWRRYWNKTADEQYKQEILT